MPILHSVFFYFRDDTPASTQNEMQSYILNQFPDIPGISNLMAGRPEGIERDVVDNSYNMSLHLVVSDRDTLQNYQNHQIHQEFIQKFKSYWKSIKVFDTAV